MNNAYTIRLLKRPAADKVHRPNFESDEEFENALRESMGKIFLQVDILDGNGLDSRRRGIHSRIVPKKDWRTALREIFVVARRSIEAHEK